jgi:hypothetical protein
MKVYILKIFLILIFFYAGLFVLHVQDISAAPFYNLPKNRDHIRLYRNYGLEEEIIRNKYDLSFDPDIKIIDPEHIGLHYDLNANMIIPSEKSSKFREWWCINKLGKSLSQCNFPESWLCEGNDTCDIPEETFLHFKNDIIITLNLGVPFKSDGGTRTGLVRGWDPNNFIDSNNDGFLDIDIDRDGNISDTEWVNRPNKNASAKTMQDARVPAFYWGKYWEYLTGETVDHHSEFAMNVGNPDYRQFMSIVYIPGIFNVDVNADGVYFDASTGYGDTWTTWIHEAGLVEYGDRATYLTDAMYLLKSIRENTPTDRIIIGNGWTYYQNVIDGNRREGWLEISIPFKNFEQAIEKIISEQENGLINLVNFNPTYDEKLIPYGKHIPVTRERDQIYGLASYYLAAGDKSYFFYAMDPYLDWEGSLFFDALNFNVGSPKGKYYSFSSQYGQKDNNVYNGNFEAADADNKPAGWDLPNSASLEIASEAECGLNGKCIRIHTDIISNYLNSQQVTLKPNTTYTLSAFVKTENVQGGKLFYGANIFPHDFDDSLPQFTGCGTSLRGTNNWTPVYCTFTTGTDVTGTVNFRIQHGTGTAWFDRIELRKGVPRTVFARKYSKALVLVRPRASEEAGYDDPVSYQLRNFYSRISADGSLGAPSDSVMLHSGEAAILGCTAWDGTNYIEDTDCNSAPPAGPVLLSPENNINELDRTVNFRWSHSIYPDEDTMTYSLSYCMNEDFTGCSPILVSSRSDQSSYYTDRTDLSHLIIIGMVFTGGIRNRKKFALLIAALLIAGGMLLSCGGGSGGSGNGGAIGTGAISEKGNSVPEISFTVSDFSYTVTGLNPDTTYYWKVTADNGESSTDSSTWSFTTL